MAAAVVADHQPRISRHLGQGFVSLWKYITDLEFNTASVKRLSKGEKKPWVCQCHFKRRLFCHASRVSSAFEHIATFFWLHKHVLLSEKKAIAALIAAQTWLHYRGAVL